jgi:translation initiation factor 1 (eIF-1/SUI1)
MSGFFAVRPLDRCTCPGGVDRYVRLPRDQPVLIRRQKRRKGKTVTVVEGLDPSASDLRSRRDGDRERFSLW